MKIGLISDVHASPVPLKQALELFTEEHVDKIICAGDIAGYNDDLDETVNLLIDYDVDCIIGNHDQTYLQTHPSLSATDSFRFLEQLPETLEYTVDGLKISVVHAQPPSEQHGGIKLLDENTQLIAQQVNYWTDALASIDADILIVGHSHQVYVQQLGSTLLINPGSAPFNHSCMILQLPQKTVSRHALEGKDILPVWNWGMLVRKM